MSNINYDLIKLLCIDGEGDMGDTSTPEVQDTPDVQTPEPETPSSYNIDGVEYTAEQIKQFESGYNNYTNTMKNYQDLEAKSREAIELYEYLQQNTELSKKLYEFEQEMYGGQAQLQDKVPTKEKETMRKLQLEVQTMKIEKEMNTIKSKDPNVDETAIYDIAIKNNLDLNMAYDIWRGRNYDKYVKAELNKQSKDLTQQIAKNGQVTKTLMSESDVNAPDNGSFGLSQAELDMCKKLEMTPQDYSEWKTKQR